MCVCVCGKYNVQKEPKATIFPPFINLQRRLQALVFSFCLYHLSDICEKKAKLEGKKNELMNKPS